MIRLACALLVLVPVTLCAQAEDAREPVKRAIHAYDDLDFERAATLLRQALMTPLDDATRVQALTYLGAAEHYRGQSDSALVVFRRLAELAPEYEPDNLVFPPEITQRYDAVRARALAQRIRPLRQVMIDTLPLSDPGDTSPVSAATAPPAPPPPAPAPVAGPRTETVAAWGGGSISRVQARSAGGLPSASGTVLGVSASARFHRFELGVGYVEGSLGTRELVQGDATLRFTTTPWLTLLAGPRIRRYATPFGAERWVAWRLGARTEMSIVPGVRVQAALWRGVGLSVNVAPGSGGAKGGAIGVAVDAAGPFSIALGYDVDQAWVNSSSRRETVRALTLGAVLRPTR